MFKVILGNDLVAGQTIFSFYVKCNFSSAIWSYFYFITHIVLTQKLLRCLCIMMKGSLTIRLFVGGGHCQLSVDYKIHLVSLAKKLDLPIHHKMIPCYSVILVSWSIKSCLTSSNNLSLIISHKCICISSHVCTITPWSFLWFFIFYLFHIILGK